MDFRRKGGSGYTPLTIGSVHLTEDLTWTLDTEHMLKKPRQRLYFLRRLRNFMVSPSILKTFYSSAVEWPHKMHLRLVWELYHQESDHPAEGGPETRSSPAVFLVLTRTDLTWWHCSSVR